MSEAARPQNEMDRLRTLREYKVLDTPPEAAFDRITHLAARIFSVPTAYVSFVDESRQWFKSCHGPAYMSTERKGAFCAYAILGKEVMVVEDTRNDDRFRDNPMVVGTPGIRFYAGAPLITSDGVALGTLCLVDLVPRSFTPDQRTILSDLAATVVDALESRNDRLSLATEVMERWQAEDSLRRSREELEASNVELRNALRQTHLFAAAIRSCGVGILISDPRQAENPTVFVNPAFEKITGYTSAEVLGQNCRMLQGSGTDAKLVEEMRQAIKEAKPFSGLVLNYRKDGAPFWNQLNINPVFDEAGQLMNFVGLQHDVTDRVKAEHDLRDSQARLQAILDNTTSIIYIKDHDSRLLLANKSFEKLFHLRQEDVLGKDNHELYPQTTADILRANDLKVLESDSPIEFEEIIERPDGVRTYISVKFPLRDGDGQVFGMCGISTDITERKKAERSLRENQARKAAILAASLDAIITIDHHGHVLEMNPATEDIFGFTQEQMIGHEMAAMIVPPEYREAHRRGMQHFLATGEGPVLGKRLELPAIKADGTRITVELTISPIVTDGPPMFTGHMRDITERKESEEKLRQAKEEAERANATKSEFLSRMSHELRTPLNAILGFSQILLRRITDERQVESVKFISKAGRQLLGMINEIFDLVGIESGQATISPEPVELYELLRDSQVRVHEEAASHAIKIQPPGEDLRGHYITGDLQRLKQIFSSLFSNAVRYNRPEGKVLIETNFRDDGWTSVSVIDTGNGIAPENLSRLFIPFERLGADSLGIEGSGLALSLAKKLVTLMGGHLEVASEVGTGSVFTVSLPTAPKPINPPGTPKINDHDEARRHTVIYVEDNPANLSLMAEVAGEHPTVRLVPVTRGNTAIEIARREKPDLILLDLHLTDISGEEILQLIRTDDDLRKVPVVVISADALATRVKKLLKDGANDYLTKPIDVTRVLGLFDQYLP